MTIIYKPNGDSSDDLHGHDEEHEEVKPPSVTGEENPASGSASSDVMNIDKSLEELGLDSDTNGVDELNIQKELDEEEK
ncbi:MAG TPA: hypothetical protein VIK81_02010 [Patescibacteria group bacterium]